MTDEEEVVRNLNDSIQDLVDAIDRLTDLLIQASEDQA